MGLLDNLLSGMIGNTSGEAAPPADKLTQNSTADAIGAGLAQAMHSDQTPPFADFVTQLFGQSTPGQRAGLLNLLLTTVGPGLLSGAAGGVLGRILAPDQARMSHDQAATVTPADAAAIAAHAATVKPNIVEVVAAFYAQHSDVVNKLGGTLLGPVVARVNQKQPD